MCLADDRVRDAFTPEEITLLETVAAQIGVAIANSRVYTRMKERDRLAALGAMAAGLAHEVKNPLGAIKGAAQLLEELDGVASMGKDPQSNEFIGIILEEVNRLDRVVGSFLDYARPHAGNPVPLDINAAVRRTVQILSSQQKGDAVEMQLDLIEPLPRAKIDPEQFRQVLMNLVQNAIQAMDGRGRVTIATAHRRTTRSTWTGGAGGPPSSPSAASLQRALHERGSAGALRVEELPVEQVEVSVRDTGPGIPQKVLRNLFVPFFTTKEQGTGLGLAISQSIVRNAGGTIDVQTQSGAGTKFTIVLPAATDALITPTPNETVAGSAGPSP
jgi:signal transduction histidine kinase